MQEGWQGGGPDKLSRAMTLASSDWAQGMIAHSWSGGPGADNEYLLMDPASGIDTDGNLVTTGYNDFANLRWLGYKVGNLNMFSTANSGKWYCVEAHVKLNTPAKSDGIFEFWINDVLQNGSYNLNWHADWNSDPDNYKINAIFVENYWNNGSPVAQERYIDNFVISTRRIGCDCASATSVDEKEAAADIVVFPNPADKVFNIKVSRETALAGYLFEMFDALGRSVFKSAVIKSLVFSQELNNFPPGYYYYRVTSGSDHVYSGELIVRNN